MLLTSHLRAFSSWAVVWLGVWATSAGAQAPPPPVSVALYAEAFAPLQYPDEENQNHPAGYVYQFVNELMAKVQKKTALQVRPLEFVPLKRALMVGEKESNVLVLSLARTPERDAKYIWLTEVSPYQLSLYRVKDQPLPPLRTLADLKGHGLRFGVQGGSNFHEWLLSQGIGRPPDNSSIDLAPQNSLNFRKALARRIDLFAHPDVSLVYRARQLGLSPTDFEAVMPIAPLSVPLWLVISKQSDPQLVQELRVAIRALKATGKFPFLGERPSK